MSDHFPGLAYNFRSTLLGKSKFDGFSDGSFDIVDGVLWFHKKRKIIGDHPAVHLAIGRLDEVDVEIQRQIALMVAVARGPGGTATLKINSGVAASLQAALAHHKRMVPQPTNVGDAATRFDIAGSLQAALDERELAGEGAPGGSAGTTFDLATQIRELARLRDDGLLTDDEFLSQKARLLQKA